MLARVPCRVTRAPATTRRPDCQRAGCGEESSTHCQATTWTFARTARGRMTITQTCFWFFQRAIALAAHRAARAEFRGNRKGKSMDCPKCKHGLEIEGEEHRQARSKWVLLQCWRCMTWWLLYRGKLCEVSKRWSDPRMSGATTIEWTDAVWNPVTGCSKVSPGCKNCYAERIFHRPYPGRAFTDVRMHPERLEQPLHWRKPRRIFVNSMSDPFHQDISAAFIDQMLAIATWCDRHTFQILTKRPQTMLAYFQADRTQRALRKQPTAWRNLRP